MKAWRSCTWSVAQECVSRKLRAVFPDEKQRSNGGLEQRAIAYSGLHEPRNKPEENAPPIATDSVEVQSQSTFLECQHASRS